MSSRNTNTERQHSPGSPDIDDRDNPADDDTGESVTDMDLPNQIHGWMLDEQVTPPHWNDPEGKYQAILEQDGEEWVARVGKVHHTGRPEEISRHKTRDAALETIREEIDFLESEPEETVKFDSLDAANDFRDSLNDDDRDGISKDALHPDDTRREKTVRLRLGYPEAIEKAQEEAFVTQDNTKKYGQKELTASERERLEDLDGWKWGTHGFHAMSTKAILLEEGGTPWLDYYSMGLEPREHVGVIESAQDMAIEEGTMGPGETGEIDDGQPDHTERAKQAGRVQGEMCKSAEDACAEGKEQACDSLLKECGYDRNDVEELIETVDDLDEDPEAVFIDEYGPTSELDEADTSFEEWARKQEPEPYERPDDEELAQIAPNPPSDSDAETFKDLPDPASEAIAKAWARYKNGRQMGHVSEAKMEKSAKVINGIRAVHGQDPFEFNDLEGFEGGRVMPDDPTEEFPTEDGQMTIEEAGLRGRLSQRFQSTVDSFAGDDCPGGTCYDPMKEFEN